MCLRRRNHIHRVKSRSDVNELVPVTTVGGPSTNRGTLFSSGWEMMLPEALVDKNPQLLKMDLKTTQMILIIQAANPI